MSESQSHKRAKSKAPGKPEVRVRGRGRVDSATSKTATQIERNRSKLPNSVAKLKASGRPRKVFQVPQFLMSDATAEMRRQNVSGTVKNMGGTKRRSVRKK
jgi:hypothetical protein